VTLARAANAAALRLADRLSAEQLAGERVIYAYAGLRPPQSLLSAVRTGRAAGVILFGSNIGGDAQIRGVIAELNRAALASPLHRRLLILTDQEGGEVRRLPGQPVLSEKEIGRSRRASVLAGAAGAGAGKNLRSVGVNVNLAPVLDVYRTPGDFIDQYARSYSSNPTTVASLGAAFIRFQQRMGVAATAKHFPGLGAAARAQNTDETPVTLRVGLPRLRATDEAPYRRAIAAGVRLVMTSWAIYPALDPAHPAGISAVVIQGELRQRLRFSGVTITDSIDAGAITPYGSVSHRSIEAAAAGQDLILACATTPGADRPSEGLTIERALAAAIRSGRLGLPAARVAAARVLALRAQP
jgi:beta-N-acetylhexosaminidase